MIIAIVQARMDSQRLPGKVMKEVMGKPLIGYLFERLKHAKNIDKILLATSVHESNNGLCEYAQSIGIDVFRGREDDVLDRFYQAAKLSKAKAIMRLTGDCPLIDPKLCDLLIQTFQDKNVDFVHTGQTFAEGLDCEIFSFEALEKSWKEAVLRSEREHLTMYMHNHPEFFKKMTLENSQDDSNQRFSVDEEEDFQVVRAILEALYKDENRVFGIADIKEFLNTNEEIKNLNRHIIRNEGLKKSLEEDIKTK